MPSIKLFGKPKPQKMLHHDDNEYKFQEYNHPQFGRHSYHGGNFQILHAHSVVGNFCSIGTNVRIGVSQHPTNFLSSHPFQYLTCFVIKPKRKCVFEGYKKVVVGNDVWIGCNAIIMDGVKIGDGAIIGAGAVVTKDVPPYAIVGGVPAKIIRYRFDPSIIKELLELRWWDLPDNKIRTLPFDDVPKCITLLKNIRASHE